MKVFAPLFALVLLSGCMTTGMMPIDERPVCTAMIGPLKYNEKNLHSRRHAGPDLALDLKARNQVGEGLGCPQYR